MINYIILKAKVLLYNFIILCGYNNVLPVHYRNFIKQYAGYREKYAMSNGQSEVVTINNHRCYKFTYSEDNEYQDANGATYDTVTKIWID